MPMPCRHAGGSTSASRPRTRIEYGGCSVTKDVAAPAGVSRALAGFVLGDDHGKSILESTREAARNLGYVPHGIARALREGNSRVVVLRIDPGLESSYSRTFARKRKRARFKGSAS